MMTDPIQKEFKISKEVGELVRKLDAAGWSIFEEWFFQFRDAGLNAEQAASSVAHILRENLVLISLFSAAVADREPIRERAIANFTDAWDQWAKCAAFALASPDEQEEMIKAAHKELWEPDTGDRDCGPGL